MRNDRKAVKAAGVALVTALAASTALTAQTVAVQVAGHELRVPRGFAVDVYASGDDVANARMMVLGPDGAVYVSLTDPGRIVRIVDANHDGRPDSITTVHDRLDNPHGMAWRGDTLYVAQTRRVVRFVPGRPQPETIVDGIPGGGHFTRTIVFGPDGKLYLSVGSSCNICDEHDSIRAAVTRYNPDGSGAERFATGLRNSVGLAFEPVTHELWATNNDRDRLGDDIPPDRINILKAGKFYGWPRCYLPNTPNPEYRGADCAGVEPPALTFQAHSAPLGIAFYSGRAFPAGYRGDVFFAQHGSWNRSVPVGYQVSHAHVRGGRPFGMEPFLTGFLVNGSAWERPVGLLVLPDGSLLVSCDSPGMILRVHWVGR